MKRCEGCGNTERGTLEPFSEWGTQGRRDGYRCQKCSRVMLR